MKKIQIKCHRLSNRSYYIADSDSVGRTPLICAEAIQHFFHLEGPVELQITLAPFKGAKRFKVCMAAYNGEWSWFSEKYGWAGWSFLYTAFGNAVASLGPKDLTQPTTIYVRCTAAAEQSPCQASSAIADLST